MVIMYTQLQKVKKKKNSMSSTRLGYKSYSYIKANNYAGVKDKLAMQEYQAPCSPTEIIQVSVWTR
jgi:hypothetical protein